MGVKQLAFVLFLAISVCAEDEEVKISEKVIESEPKAGYIDGRVLPATSLKNNGEPYEITNERLQQIRSSFMYWFYDEGGNENNGDYQKEIQRFTPVIEKDLNFQLPFYGFRFNYTRVSMDGHIFFSDLDNYYTYPVVFPVPDWPKHKDPSFIGIFFSKCRIGNQSPNDPDQRKPGVYFRLDNDLQNRTDQLGVEMRERLTWDIREGIIGAETFTPKHAITVTWKNMSFAGGIDSAMDITNTFQMVLATDEVFTYAIFNYLEINWNSHTEAGGDTAMGIGGIPAYVGFNAGNRTRAYEYQPYSQSPKIQRLTRTGMANGFPGRHIFRIDEEIMAGTCKIDSGYIDGRVLPATSLKNNGEPYEITNERLQQIRSSFMYWFYDEGGNQNNGDYQKEIQRFTPVIEKDLNFQLPFYGFRFNYTRVSMDGYIFFSDLDNYYTYPVVFPVPDWPKHKDPSFIGIFFSKCRIGNQSPNDPDQRKPGVYFRLDNDLQSRTDQLGVEMRERLTWDIREGIIGAETFTPKHAITVTWKNMSFAGGIDSAMDITNTFQMVLATDEVFTYAIFNYLEINWNSHTEAGGDTAMGIGGIPAYVGFNAGNRTRAYEYQPYSQSPKIQRLTRTGMANGFPGRHIFRIDEEIMAGTCKIDSGNLYLH